MVSYAKHDNISFLFSSASILTVGACVLSKVLVWLKMNPGVSGGLKFSYICDIHEFHCKYILLVLIYPYLGDYH